MSTVPTNPPANPVPGTVYVDLATNIAYVYTGTGWAPSGGSTGYNSGIGTGSAILPGYFAQPTPESYVPQVGSEPAVPSEGLIWVDDTVTPSPAYVWHGTSWFKITDGTFTDTTVSSVPPASPDLGDTYYETSTSRFYVWDGTAWKTIGESDDTNSIFTMSAPVSRPDGQLLKAGDLWVNSATNELSYWTGSTWTLMATSCIVPYASAPAIGPAGAVYYNTTDKNLYTSDGVSWVRVGATDTNSIPSATAPTTRLNGDPLQDGDLWFDSGINELKAWYSGVWNAVGAPEVFIDTNSIPSPTQPTTKLNGDPLQEGDLWFDTGTNELKAWYGGIWNTVSAFSNVVDTNSIISLTQPTTRLNGDPLQDGDLWFVGENALYIHYAGEWFQTHNVYNTNSIPSATAPTTRANGDALQDGDLWYSTLAGSLSVWTGGAWVGFLSAQATKDILGTVYADTALGGSSTSLGYLGGMESGDANTALGFMAGQSSTGDSNTLVGYRSGDAFTGDGNVFVGLYSGRNSTNAYENTVVGTGCLNASAGTGASFAQTNTLIGYNIFDAPGSYLRNIIIGWNGAKVDGTSTVAPTNDSILIGNETWPDGDGCLIIGTGIRATENSAVIAYGKGTDSSSHSILLRGNAEGAWGLWDGGRPLSTSGVSYGSTGQFLASRGTGAPPRWVTPPGRYVSGGVGPVSALSFNIDQTILLDPADTLVPISAPTVPGEVPEGAFIKIVAQQTTSPITFSNNSGPIVNFMGGTNIYSWTPAFVGQTATITYYSAFLSDGFGYLVELSSN